MSIPLYNIRTQRHNKFMVMQNYKYELGNRCKFKTQQRQDENARKNTDCQF